MINWLYFLFLSNWYDFYLFVGVAEQIKQNPPDKQFIKFVKGDKQRLGVMLVKVGSPSSSR